MKAGEDNLRSKMRSVIDGAATGLAVLSTLMVVTPLAVPVAWVLTRSTSEGFSRARFSANLMHSAWRCGSGRTKSQASLFIA